MHEYKKPEGTDRIGSKMQSGPETVLAKAGVIDLVDHTPNPNAEAEIEKAKAEELEEKTGQEKAKKLRTGKEQKPGQDKTRDRKRLRVKR